MLYFTNFPITYYEVQPARYGRPAEYIALSDITRNVRFKKEVLDKISLYDTYTMADGQTIEQVSEELYGSPYYHWVLMLLNDKFDYINDFPLSVRAFDRYIDKKYNFAFNDDTYLEYTYGVTPESLVVDVVNIDGHSVDFVTPNMRVIDRQNNNVQYRDIMSLWGYDSVLKMPIKQFAYIDHYADTTSITADSEIHYADYFAGTYNSTTNTYTVQRLLDTKTHSIDWGSVSDYTPVYAYDLEVSRNETKREIKVISESVLQTVLKNFKDLM